MEDESIPSDMFQPLYPGAVVTICGAHCAIMSYAVNNKLPYSAIGNLLKLLHLLCPASSQLPSSYYKLRKFFQSFTSSYKKQRKCAECEESSRSEQSCHGRDGYFIQIPVEKALKTITQSKYNLK